MYEPGSVSLTGEKNTRQGRPQAEKQHCSLLLSTPSQCSADKVEGLLTDYMPVEALHKYLCKITISWDTQKPLDCTISH